MHKTCSNLFVTITLHLRELKPSKQFEIFLFAWSSDPFAICNDRTLSFEGSFQSESPFAALDKEESVRVDKNTGYNPFDEDLSNPFIDAEPNAVSTPELHKDSEPTKPLVRGGSESLCNKENEREEAEEKLTE